MKKILNFNILNNTFRYSYILLNIILKHSLEGKFLLKILSFSRKIILCSFIIFTLVLISYVYFGTSEINQYINDIVDYQDCNLYVKDNYIQSSNNLLEDFVNLFTNKTNFSVPSYFINSNIIDDSISTKNSININYRGEYSFILNEYEKLKYEHNSLKITHKSLVDDLLKTCQDMLNSIKLNDIQ